MPTPIQSRVVYKVKLIERSLRTVMDSALADTGITSAHYGALSALAEAPDISSAQLARLCMVSAQSMHELVSILTTAGFMEREQQDGRSSQLRVTATGSDLLRRADPIVDRVEESILESSEPQATHDLLDALLERLQAAAGSVS
jgi:DNA-binding MarR family transcriptional regulator